MTLAGFLRLGEAGSLIAADLAAAGVSVRGWDPLVPQAKGVETTAGPAALAAAIAPTGAVFADVALLQSVPGRGVRTPALASSPGAVAFAERFGAWGMPVDVGSEEPGYAASRKLARSVFLEGLAAAAGEALAAGEAWLGELAASHR